MKYAIPENWKEIGVINHTEDIISNKILYMFPSKKEAYEKLIELHEGIIENLEDEIFNLESRVTILHEKIETFRRKANG